MRKRFVTTRRPREFFPRLLGCSMKKIKSKGRTEMKNPNKNYTGSTHGAVRFSFPREPFCLVFLRSKPQIAHRSRHVYSMWRGATHLPRRTKPKPPANVHPKCCVESTVLNHAVWGPRGEKRFFIILGKHEKSDVAKAPSLARRFPRFKGKLSKVDTRSLFRKGPLAVRNK